MDIDIVEYTTPRSYLRGLVEEALRRERENIRIRGLVKTAKEAAEHTARQGRTSVRLFYGANDITVIYPLLGRVFMGCTLTINNDEIAIDVDWA